MSSERKIRKCPHCKSKRGFQIYISLGGHEHKEMDFNGKLLKQDRDGTDDIDKYASCLDCNKLIDSKKLDLKNV